MPSRVYMGVDARRDHSFRIPRPDRTLTLGVPNACGQCHDKQGAQWAADAVRAWYPAPAAGFQDFAEGFRQAEVDAPGAMETLLAIVRDEHRSPWVRASALRRLGPLHRADASHRDAVLNAVTSQLNASDDTLRWAAVAALGDFSTQERATHLAPRLQDERRLVRIEAARLLAGEAETLLSESDRASFSGALNELLAAEAFNADRPEAQTRLGDLHSARGQGEIAEKSYRRAIEIDPAHLPASVNLAQLLERRGQAGAALAVLREALAVNAGSAEIEHALGLALIRGQQYGEALEHLARAAAINPSAARFVYVHLVATHDVAGVRATLEPLRAALETHPRNAQLLELGVVYFAEAGERAAALRAMKSLAEVQPRRAAEIAATLRLE
jgi:tetratricopeptide (TPR) repeat protein